MHVLIVTMTLCLCCMYPHRRFTPSGGGRARRGRGLKDGSKSGRGSKSGSRAQSEEGGSHSSGSEHSDLEQDNTDMVRESSVCVELEEA